MFSRNCELEVQGVEDSSSEESESEESGSGSDEEGEREVERELVGEGTMKVEPDEDSDDGLAIINEDGTETKINAAYMPKLNPKPKSKRKARSHAASSSSNSILALATGTSLPLLKKRRRKTNLDPHLTFGCSSCLRPLLLDASTSSRRIYALACGHLVDGWCLAGL